MTKWLLEATTRINKCFVDHYIVGYKGIAKTSDHDYELTLAKQNFVDNYFDVKKEEKEKIEIRSDDYELDL